MGGTGKAIHSLLEPGWAKKDLLLLILGIFTMIAASDHRGADKEVDGIFVVALFPIDAIPSPSS